jgi:hypothetical protein
MTAPIEWVDWLTGGTAAVLSYLLLFAIVGFGATGNASPRFIVISSILLWVLASSGSYEWGRNAERWDMFHKSATPLPVVGRVATSSGGAIVGRLLPMPTCPEQAVCADPGDYD